VVEKIHKRGENIGYDQSVEESLDYLRYSVPKRTQTDGTDDYEVPAKDGKKYDNCRIKGYSVILFIVERYFHFNSMHYPFVS
jgi:hypothetical protein